MRERMMSGLLPRFLVYSSGWMGMPFTKMGEYCLRLWGKMTSMVGKG